jgi:hypothetical protein
MLQNESVGKLGNHCPTPHCRICENLRITLSVQPLFPPIPSQKNPLLPAERNCQPAAPITMAFSANTHHPLCHVMPSRDPLKKIEHRIVREKCNPPPPQRAMIAFSTVFTSHLAKKQAQNGTPLYGKYDAKKLKSIANNKHESY